MSNVRQAYLRGGEKYDTRITGAAIKKVADLLDIADSKTPATVYPELRESQDSRELAVAWCWAAVLIADLADVDSATMRALGNAINGIYKEGR